MKEIVPRYNQIVTTANKFTADECLENIYRIDRKKDTYKTQQQIVSVGPNVRDLKVGDWVEIVWNERYIEYSEEWLKKNKSLAGFDPLARASHLNYIGYSVRYPVVSVDGEERLLIYDNDMLFKFVPKD